jgi:hypothetical protein
LFFVCYKLRGLLMMWCLIGKVFDFKSKLNLEQTRPHPSLHLSLSLNQHDFHEEQTSSVSSFFINILIFSERERRRGKVKEAKLKKCNGVNFKWNENDYVLFAYALLLCCWWVSFLILFSYIFFHSSFYNNHDIK